MMSILIHALIIAGIYYLCIRKAVRFDDKLFFSAFILLKIASGILIGVLYWFYYDGKGDTIYFFEQAQVLFQYYQEGKLSFSQCLGFSPLNLSANEFSAQSEPRTLFFVKLISLFYFLTQGNYWTIAVYLSFLSGMVSWAFAHELVKFTPKNKYAVYTALLFIPSIVFWSSGLLKESIMSMSLYLLGYSILRIIKDSKSLIFYFWMLLSVFLLWKLKYYVPITLLPIVSFTLFFSQSKKLESLSFSKKIALYLFFLMASGMAVAFVHPVFHSGRFFELLRISHDAIAANSSAAKIQFLNAQSDLLFFLKNLPLAWFSGWFRPFIWEAFDSFSFLWALEKSIFSLLWIFAIISTFKVKFSDQEKWWGIAILIYAAVLSPVITLATPNFGSLVRYEVAYMPFLWLLVFIILNKYRQQLK